MRPVPVVEAKSHFSALLAAVEGGEVVAITRHGRVVARLMPDTPRMAADVFRPFWAETDWDMEAPADSPPDPVAALD
ncbi:MAG: type II toxin-antitoxin system Phd/YefM family antitoxin [Sulfuricellaceae bacterium]